MSGCSRPAFSETKPGPSSSPSGARRGRRSSPPVGCTPSTTPSWTSSTAGCQLNLSTAIYLPEEGEIRVTEGEAVTGVIVHLAPGSGLIKRCPVEGCNRVLSRQNYCPVHEIQKDFRYDLRIKGVLDDGIRHEKHPRAKGYRGGSFRDEAR